jgi:phosphomannomutase
LAEKKCSVTFLRDSYPKYIISKNKIELTPSIDVDRLLEKMITEYKNHEIDTTDGVKIYFDKEWVHLRKSNTEPIIRIYSESQNKEKAEQLAQNIIGQIKSLID